MNIVSLQPLPSKSRFINWPLVNALPRDQGQSEMIHGPSNRINATDPMTGGDIEDVMQHSSVIDGNLTVHFESDASYQELPLNHPDSHLPVPPTNDGERGG